MHARLSKRKLKVAFVEHLSTEIMGTMMVSAVLKQAGHETRLFLESKERDLVDAVVSWEPDLVAAQTRTGQHVWALELCERIKSAAPHVKVVLGGPHATYIPEIIERRGVDIVVRGEGEYVMRDVCAAIAARDDYTAIRGTWVKDAKGEIHENPIGELIRDLDALPYADRELPYRYRLLRNRGNKTFIPGRGCQFPCTFCHNHLAMRLYQGQGRWARKMTPDRFIDEILWVRDKYPPLRIVNLENDDEILHLGGWAEDFFARYRSRVGLPHYVMTRPDSITEELVKLLKESNCIGVSLSLETANETLRNQVLKKGFSTDDVRNAMEILNRYRIPTKLFNIVGIPGETLDDALATLRLATELKPTWARCSILQPYPPMDLYQYCKQNGLFKRDFDPDDFDYFYLKSSQLDFPGIDRLVNLQKFFSITAKYPILLPLVKQLIKLRPNRVYETIGMAFYGWFGARYDRVTVGEFIAFALASMAFLIPRRGRRGLPKAY